MTVRVGSKAGSAVGTQSQPTHYVGALGESERVFDIDAEIADCAFDLSVTQQDLNCPEVAGNLVNDGRLRPPQRMRSIIFSTETDPSHPFVDQPGILASADVIRRVAPTRKA
jgi:hypothetical protein